MERGFELPFSLEEVSQKIEENLAKKGIFNPTDVDISAIAKELPKIKGILEMILNI